MIGAIRLRRASSPDVAYGLLAVLVPVVVIVGQLFAEAPIGDVTSDQHLDSISAGAAIDHSSDLARYREFNSKLRAEFEPGSVELRISDVPKLTEAVDGFVIRMESGSPVATPTVYDGRLYVSGGFNSTEFHCFDAVSGQHVWTADLSDDGPSLAAIDDGVLTISTESCTLFALNARTGEHLWSFYLGDPLLSSPTVANGRVFAVYPLPDNDDPGPAGSEPRPEAKTEAEQQPQPDSQRSNVLTHALACFELRTGHILWQHALDTDCITAPIASAEFVYIATMSGRLYCLMQEDGIAVAAYDLQATTPPVVDGKSMYVSRRLSPAEGQTVREAIVHCDLFGRPIQGSALSWNAPHLDRGIQELSAFTKHATEIEAANGIGGGFGGGFGGGGGGGGGGFFQVTETSREFEAAANGQSAAPPDASIGGATEFPDLLARTQNQAADIIGLGNVATLQCYQGSRPLLWSDRCFSCIGSNVVCLSAASGELIWELPLKGDARELGGHLGTPPVAAGDWLFVATVGGEVLQIAPTDGTIARRYDARTDVRFAPTITDGRIYLGTQAGEVRCIRTDDPKVTGWPTWGGDPAHSNICRRPPPWQQ